MIGKEAIEDQCEYANPSVRDDGAQFLCDFRGGLREEVYKLLQEEIVKFPVFPEEISKDGDEKKREREEGHDKEKGDRAGQHRPVISEEVNKALTKDPYVGHDSPGK